MFKALYAHHARFADLVDRTSHDLLSFVARIAAAVPFWRSGQSKLEGSEILGIKWNLFAVKDSKIYLFQYEFGFPEAIAPTMTHLAAIGENLLPLALVFGLFSRLGALGLIIMTLVIQFYVFPDHLARFNGNWSLHLLWLFPLLYVLTRGPGAWSLDAIIGKRFHKGGASLGEAHTS